MFSNAGLIPSNIVFNENFAKLLSPKNEIPTKQYSLQSAKPTIESGGIENTADVIATKANDIRRQVEEKSKKDPCIKS